MSYAQAERLSRLLSKSGVELTPQPRGFGKERGVPDSVVWVRPESITVDRVFPILVELEGRLFNVDDFKKFARRTSAKEPYQHHVELPIVDGEAEPVSATLPYDVFALGSQLLIELADPSESQFHDAVRNWFGEYSDTFETDARITVREQTRLVWWTVGFTMFGHSFNTQIPSVSDTRKIEEDHWRHYGLDLDSTGTLEYDFIVRDGPAIDVLVISESEYEFFQNDENYRYHTDVSMLNDSGARVSGQLSAGSYRLVFDNTNAGDAAPPANMSNDVATVEFSFELSQ